MYGLQASELIMSIIASAFTILGVIIALITLIVYVFERRETDKNLKFEKAVLASEKATERAQVFQTDIVPNISFLYRLYVKTGYMNFMAQHMGKHDSYEFNKEEFHAFFSEEDRKRIEEFDSKCTMLLVKAAYAEAPPIILRDIASISSNEEAMDYVFTVRMSTLNTLEWFCMLFTSDVAASEKVYQSLHMLFLKYIGLEYPAIAEINEFAYDKCYTNTIALYNKWLHMYKSAKQKEEAEISGKKSTCSQLRVDYAQMSSKTIDVQ